MATVMRTDRGKVRKINEDAAWFDERTGIFAVADGMGGHLAGEVASTMAIQAVQEMSERESSPSIRALREMMDRVNRQILEKGREDSSCSGMGTTLSVLWKAQRYMYIAHVGDSRIYRFRKEENRFEQITRDHSLVEEMVQSGILSREEARIHPRRNIITRALGTEGDNQPDILAADTREGDVWLLCSDGLTTMVDDRTIASVLAGRNLAEASDALLSAALLAGGYDNITLILHEEERKWNRD
ncbi:MAG: Stp1/IreP family PP2C-type Ser/Thr phosphatase [Clostridiales bacterium]|nr:Stp1/IreP family PP2C-type Ser/Thr phosphatase [Clostridiales bacterium]